MKLPLYQIDAFTDRPFGGNPAAVVPLEAWLPDATLQAIAEENHLSETAFFVGANGSYQLRWFTPTREVDLCGHATLASAWLLFDRHPTMKRIVFSSRSGALPVTREGDRLTLDFPVHPNQPADAPPALVEALGATPREVRATQRDWLCVFDSPDQVRALAPDFGRLAALDRVCTIVTAPGGGADFVSRFFAPAVGVPEDPVTGSAHCALVPYWAERLGKRALHAKQISARGGELWCELRGDRVAIAGSAVLYLEGAIFI